jgi:NAD(P)-dependent dehydrogenase (short-subunit alcohol dehydrogenase family)
LDLSLEGKVALVTGGSKGIGRAIALGLAEAGADVAIGARGAEDLERTAKEIESAGRRALAVSTDASDPDQIQALVDRTVAELGTLDILVNNVGAAPFFSTIDSIRPDGFEKYFRLNFMAAVYASRTACKVLLEKGSGCVLNVASVAAFIATPGLTYYGPAKAAMVQLTKTAAREWAAYGVRVNAVAPGWIETDMNVGARQSEEFNQGILSQIPLGRWGTPEDVASAAVFLCSPAASWITGSVLIVDGGQSSSVLVGQ